MAQDINSILQELDAGYNPQRQAINDQIAQLQPQADAQIQGLNQTKDTAYRDISRNAADRGMYFSSIPSQDQADYVQKTYVPAIAQVQQSMNQTKNSLLDSLNNVNLDQRKTAYGIQSDQQNREQQAAQAAQARADQLAAQKAANAGASGLAGLFGDTPSPTAKPAAASYQKRADGGYNFQDHNGKAISAAQYSQLTGTPLRTLLQQMAQGGDNGAKTALNYVGDDYGVNAAKLGNNQQAIGIVNSILGGINQYKSAAAKAPAPSFKPPTSFSGIVNPLALRR